MPYRSCKKCNNIRCHQKYLKYKGFNVTYVRNFTDIDDKIINRAKQEGISWDAVAKKYTDEYYRDMDRLGVKRADVEPKATEHIENITIVQGLIDKGFAYEADGGVYFAVDKFSEYGKLSKRDKDDMIAGARVEVDERRKTPWILLYGRNQKKVSRPGIAPGDRAGPAGILNARPCR